MKKILSTLVLVLGLVGLVGCGGSGGNNTTPPDPKPPVPSIYPGIFRRNGSPTTSSAQMLMVNNPTTSGSLDMSSPRSQHTGTALNDGRVVIIGGGGDSAVPVLTIDIFHPDTETFTTSAAVLPAARLDHCAALTDDGQVALVGGGPTSLDVYDPATDSILTKIPNLVSNDLVSARLLNIGNHRLLLYGGMDANTILYSPKIIDTQTWTYRDLSKDSVHLRIRFSILQLKDGRVLISGGDTLPTPAAFQTQNDILIFDPATETFATVGHMNANRSWHSSLELPSGKIGIYGGMVLNPNETRLKSTETFDLTTGVSTTEADLIDVKTNMLSAYLENGYTLHVGGWDQTYTTNTEMIYDPTANTSGYTGAMLDKRLYFSMTPLNNGKLLIAGGHDTADNMKRWATAEIFDPQASIYLTYPYADLPLGESMQITASGSTNGLTWSTDSGSVDQNGKFTAPDTMVATRAYITVTNSAGVKAICHINFIQSVISVSGPGTVAVDSVNTYTAHVDFYQDQTVTWTSDKGSIDSNGAFTAPHDPGTVTITATSTVNTKQFISFRVVVQ